jgi:2-keto-4-pentenoate hydratase/2-oxohepta-3-ene-1,7-dioic acid hydratase in catechol pathway
MKITRYRNTDGSIGYAGATDEHEFFALDGDLFGSFELTGNPVEIEKQLAPVDPRIVLAIGLNYRQHAEESGLPVPKFPVLFVKPGGAVQNPRDPIVLPACTKRDEVDYECELAVVIGKPCRDATPENALDHVLGYTCANDVSARDWQLNKSGGQWCRGKSFDTFAPLGPCLVTTDEIPDPNNLRIRTVLNGETVQDSNTRDMIFSVPELITSLSAGMTLQPGTVIMTGTPQGVGMARKPPVWLKDGDSVTVIIENIGALTNPVVEEPGRS